MAARAGLDAQEWRPRELRHSFVSLLSDAGVSIEEIARSVGHRGTVVTQAVNRKQLRPVITEGAEAMDRILGTSTDAVGPQTGDLPATLCHCTTAESAAALWTLGR